MNCEFNCFRCSREISPTQNKIDETPSSRNCVNLRGDGNCFYRLLSVAVTGSDNFDKEIRQQLVAYMLSDRIETQIHGLNENRYAFENAISNGVWATDVKISAAAAYLCSDIFVFTTNGRPYTKLTH